MNVALVTLLFSAVAITSSSGTSLLSCSSFTCTPDYCEQRQCPCGSYKDHCGCCDLCYQCPGDQCNPWLLIICSENHECVRDDPGMPFEMGAIGHCAPINATEASHIS
ncbi:8.6 kDa transglutaminase substrate-like [Rhipicephalus sanguineus]|uniref:8.6 kDa transglutaminase substrate-like n=1 Tax=Rhipicephalus sanguineus TaxID=34632 RepID=UPI0018947FED|nr:8.6 kDa transglutaminase substrate-like [Rhipicephalus sanguineus]